jgi:hypothetical protein
MALHLKALKAEINAREQQSSIVQVPSQTGGASGNEDDDWQIVRHKTSRKPAPIR